MKTIRFIMGLLSGIGVSSVLNNIVKHVRPEKVSTFTKVCETLGTMVVGGIVAKQVDDHLDKTITKLDGTEISVKIGSKEEEA